MKSKLLLVSLAFSAGAILAEAEDPPLPAKTDAPESPAPVQTPDAPTTAAPQLMPSPPAVPQIPDVPELSQLDEMFKRTSLGKEADEQRLSVEWRRLENQIVGDPEFVSMRATAEAAPTDLEKRNRLRTYYNAYYDRMRAMAASPELKAYLDQKRAEHLGRLAQPRVRSNGSPPPAPVAPKKSKQNKHPH